MVLDEQTLTGLSSILQRLDALERSSSSSSSSSSETESFDRGVSSSTAVTTDLREQVSELLGTGSERLTGRAIRRAVRKVSQLSGQVARLTALLRTDECGDNPCRNGGTCTDLFAGFHCACASSFTGRTCEADVNECTLFAGTDMGCQNGATCRNTHGGYQCLCPAGWFGVHCTERSDDCLSASRVSLCEHGTCVNVVGQRTRNYRCICDQGWTGADCSEDVDECRAPRYPCSVSPKAECVNVPGGFACASCPTGFTGSGQTCFDVDECATPDNGGCSLSPRVQCTNTPGSRSCGPCPPGFAGDGQSCQWVGACGVDNGHCHPLATCLSNPAISASFRECRCPSGFTGSGVGVDACQRVTVTPHPTNCYDNPCLFGTCHPVVNASSGFSCHCFPGYSGPRCEDRRQRDGTDACDFAPCRNGGTCVRHPDTASSSSLSYDCICTSSFQGTNCEEERSACGGVLNSPAGQLVHPSAYSNNYLPNSDCAWVVRTESDKVLTLTFSNMSLEEGPDCSYDYLSVYDGPDHSFPVLRKMCGTRIPDPLTSSHNSVYLWFHSDPDRQSQGFRLQWNSSAPTCGAVLPPADFGSVNSPAYPGHYPPDRDCFWLVQVPLDRRILFSFAVVAIESHPDCGFDYLKLYDGELVSVCSLFVACCCSLLSDCSSHFMRFTPLLILPCDSTANFP